MIGSVNNQKWKCSLLRICSILLCFVLIILMLTACKKEPTKSDSSSSSLKVTESTETSSVENDVDDSFSEVESSEITSHDKSTSSTKDKNSESSDDDSFTKNESSKITSSNDKDTSSSSFSSKSQDNSSANGTSSIDRANTVQNTVDRAEMITRLSELKVSDIGFGYYGATLDDFGIKTDVADMIKSDYANVFTYSGEYALKLIAENNSKVWVNVYKYYKMICDDKIGWEDSFDKMAKDLKDTGCWDSVLGWYLDEPLEHEAILTLSKYAYEKYKKRFFICYFAASMAPEYSVLGSYDKEGISERTTEYITDIAYDLYWDVTTHRDVYEYVNRSMHKRLGKNNPKIWYIPYLAVWGKDLEETVENQQNTNLIQLAHLELMYEFLKQEENPGGLMCYAYNVDDTSFEDQYGWKEANKLSEGIFDTLFRRSVEIGREICTGKSGLD